MTEISVQTRAVQVEVLLPSEHGINPVVEAVADMVSAGASTERQLYEELSPLSSTFVGAALEESIRLGLVVEDDDRLSAQPLDSRWTIVSRQLGWLVWDPFEREWLPRIILGDKPPAWWRDSSTEALEVSGADPFKYDWQRAGRTFFDRSEPIVTLPSDWSPDQIDPNADGLPRSWRTLERAATVHLIGKPTRRARVFVALQPRPHAGGEADFIAWLPDAAPGVPSMRGLWRDWREGLAVGENWDAIEVKLRHEWGKRYEQLLSSLDIGDQSIDETRELQDTRLSADLATVRDAWKHGELRQMALDALLWGRLDSALKGIATRAAYFYWALWLDLLWQQLLEVSVRDLVKPWTSGIGKAELTVRLEQLHARGMGLGQSEQALRGEVKQRPLLSAVQTKVVNAGLKQGAKPRGDLTACKRTTVGERQFLFAAAVVAQAGGDCEALLSKACGRAPRLSDQLQALATMRNDVAHGRLPTCALEKVRYDAIAVWRAFGEP